MSGHAAAPEKNANQPFVIGSGPSCMRRTKPPTPARSAHAHPMHQAIAASTFAASIFTLLLRSADANARSKRRNPRSGLASA